MLELFELGGIMMYPLLLASRNSHGANLSHGRLFHYPNCLEEPKDCNAQQNAFRYTFGQQI